MNKKEFALCYKESILADRTFKTEAERKEYRENEIYKINTSLDFAYYLYCKDKSFFRLGGMPGLRLRRYNLYDKYKGDFSLIDIDQYILNRYEFINTPEEYIALVEELDNLTIIEYRKRNLQKHQLIDPSYKKYFDFKYLSKRIADLLINHVLSPADNNIFLNIKKDEYINNRETLARLYEYYMLYEDQIILESIKQKVYELLLYCYTNKEQIKYYQFRKAVIYIKNIDDEKRKKDLPFQNDIGKQLTFL